MLYSRSNEEPLFTKYIRHNIKPKSFYVFTKRTESSLTKNCKKTNETTKTKSADLQIRDEVCNSLVSESL